MVASRRSSRSSIVMEYKALSTGKRQRERKSSVSEPAPKRQRTRNNHLKIFDFASASDDEDEDEENDDPQSPDKRRSSARLNSAKATPEMKKNGTGQKVSVSVVIDTPMKSTNGKSGSGRGRSPCPVVSNPSSDEPSSSRTPLTPSKRYAQPHSIPKSGKKVSNLTKKLSEVTETKVQKTPVEVKVEGENIPISTARSKTSRSAKTPPPVEFERIKHHVLSKLCGRTPIRLIGKAATISKYPPTTVHI
jgi:hypothetical protein